MIAVNRAGPPPAPPTWARDRHDAERALDAFRGQLRDAVDLNRVRAELAGWSTAPSSRLGQRPVT